MKDNKCKICNSVTTPIINKKTNVKYHTCSYCEFTCKDEKHFVTKKEELTIYNFHNNFIYDPEYIAFFKKFINKAILPYASNIIKGLDFGSGPQPVLAELLKREYNYKMHIYDVFFAPEKVYENNKYDLVTCTEVVEHLKNPLEYFKIFKSLINNNGIIAVMTLLSPNNEKDFFDWWYIRDKTHISFFTLKTMQVIASKLGLKIVYTDNKRYITLKKVNK
jgi:hypothetical protein